MENTGEEEDSFIAVPVRLANRDGKLLVLCDALFHSWRLWYAANALHGGHACFGLQGFLPCRSMDLPHWHWDTVNISFCISILQLRVLFPEMFSRRGQYPSDGRETEAARRLWVGRLVFFGQF